MTFQNLQTRVSELINQSLTDDNKTVTLTEVKAWLNIGYKKAYNALVSTSQNYGARWATANLVANQAYYSLPTDFRKMRRVELAYESTTNFYRASRLDRNALSSPSTTHPTSGPTYSIIGEMIELNPIPSTNVTGGLKMLYIEDPSDMTSDNDVPKLPLGYHYLPVLYAVGKAKQRLGLKGEAESSMAEFAMDIETMKEETADRGGDSNDFVIIRDMYTEV